MKKGQTDEAVRKAVRQTYGDIATRVSTGCGCAPSGCCSDVSRSASQRGGPRIGYSDEERQGVPEGADMGLGCGNPQAIAELQPGETVLDLGSGGGFDCFLAAKQVGPTGHVIGVDMTPEMVSKARENIEKGGYANVEFRIGEIENLPAADASVDVILSNCVINLSRDKPRVYRETYRVLRPGGRLAIFDVMATAEMPDEVRSDLALHVGCIAGAATMAELRQMLNEVGFEEIRIQPRDESREFIREWAPGANVADYIVSVTVEAVKPGN